MAKINLAAKQMCMEAARTARIDGSSDVIEQLVQSGHCYCAGIDLAGVHHRECCKCRDRYAEAKAPE